MKLPLASLAVSRRTLLRAGAAAGVASLLRPLCPLAGAALDPRSARSGPGTAKNVILLWMSGGPSHLDTFDLKPGTKFAGSFAPIATNVDGVQICEHLPQLAQRANRLAIVRSVTSAEADHGRGYHLLHTGHMPVDTVDHPAILSVAAEELAPEPGALPTSVTVGYTLADGGCLGNAWSPFVVGNPDAPATAFRLPEGLARGRQAARLAQLDAMNREFAARTNSPKVAGGEALWRRAAAMIGEEAATAFDIAQEPEERRARYGDSPFGRGCLLARRLIHHGVRFVEVVLDGWDTHADNFTQTQALMAQLDPAFAALLDDLDGDGHLGDTLVLWSGEFGRTPEINPDAGRDHHAAVFSAVLAGGGVKGGQIIGASNDSGHEVKDRAVTVFDLLASVYGALGLDPRTQYHTPEGRPIRRLDQGQVVPELFG